MPKITNPDTLASNMTKREHFAGLIAAGLAADGATTDDLSFADMADYAVDLADALIARLAKK